jgi:TrmH family RNA methyltransferase
VKQVLRLQEKRARQKTGRFAVEGAREINRALSCGFELQFLLAYQPFATSLDAKEVLAQLSSEKIWWISEVVFKKIAIRESTDGLMAVFNQRKLDINGLDIQPRSFFIAVDHVEKPGNLGAILRTADATGVSALFVLGSSVDLYNPNVIRASLGTVFHVPVFFLRDDEFYQWIDQHQVKTLALSPESRTTYFDFNFSDGPYLALFGNEADGLRQELKSRSTYQLSIPMKGIADSLNLSVSVALIAYESLRQAST